LQLKAPGYCPLVTSLRDFDEGDWDADFQLQPTDFSGGTVSLPDGRPAAGARLWGRRNETDGFLYLYRPNTYSGDRLVKGQADSNGKFNLPDTPDDQPLIFTAPEGLLATTPAEVKKHPDVRLQSWGRVEGVLTIADRPKGGIDVNLATLYLSGNSAFNLSYSATTAPDGSFAFDNVAAGEYKLYRVVRTRMGRALTEDHQFPVSVTAGKTAKVQYRNAGRAVIGQAVTDKPGLLVDWLNDDHTLTLVQAPDAGGQDALKLEDFATAAAFTAARVAAMNSPDRFARERDARTYVFAFEEDGSFRADDVPPGKYQLNIRVTKPYKSQEFRPFADPQDNLGSLSREIVVPPGDAPLDLGTLSVTMKGGDTAAAHTPPVKFSATALDGKSVSLKQYQGRYLVLAFWSLWSDRSADELKAMQNLQNSLGADSRIAFLGVAVGDDPAAVAKAVASRGYKWTQATLNSTNLATVAASFDVSSLPAIYLIDPDGRILSRDLAGDRLAAGVGRILRKN
jgi:peroxiredoxin